MSSTPSNRPSPRPLSPETPGSTAHSTPARVQRVDPRDPRVHAHPPRERALTPAPITSTAPQPALGPEVAGGQFYEWFMTMCAQRQVDPTTVARACGFSHATITNWRKTGAAPQPQTCRLIADYFTYPYLLTLRYAGHLTADDLALSRDPETLRLQVVLSRATVSPDDEDDALALRPSDALPAPEDPAPFTDAQLVARAKLAIAQVPGLPDGAVNQLSHLIDLYANAAQATQQATQQAYQPFRRIDE